MAKKMESQCNASYIFSRTMYSTDLREAYTEDEVEMLVCGILAASYCFCLERGFNYFKLMTANIF